ncbi:MAG TPA: YCF48-related protein [Ignavibacteria bacterium]|nr:YCF48-related protein [Ignavibacteria bacterium]
MRILLLVLLLAAFKTAGAQWQPINVTEGSDIFGASFLSSQTGYVCGYGNRLQKTTDGGVTWIDLSFEGTQHNLNSVEFINNLTGFLASSNDTVYKTSDGGFTWYHKYFIGYPVMNIQFLDSMNGFASGYNKFSVTTNSGATWTTSSAPADGNIYFLNSLTGWSTKYLGGGNSELHKTTNGGVNWTLQLSTTGFRILYDVFFVNQNTGWVSGYRHYIARTTNGGANWEVQHETESGPGLYSIRFINSQTGWTAGDRQNSVSCYYTTNGGSDWLNETGVVHSGRLTKVRFISSVYGWIVGQYGKAFKTLNAGGLTGIKNPVSGVSGFELNQNYPNPFNPSTVISFSVPERGFVSLKIYDALGREVAEPVNGVMNGGFHSVKFDAGNLSAGIYFYKLISGRNSSMRKMIVLK